MSRRNFKLGVTHRLNHRDEVDNILVMLAIFSIHTELKESGEEGKKKDKHDMTIMVKTYNSPVPTGFREVSPDAQA